MNKMVLQLFHRFITAHKLDIFKNRHITPHRLDIFKDKTISSMISHAKRVLADSNEQAAQNFTSEGPRSTAGSWTNSGDLAAKAIDTPSAHGAGYALIIVFVMSVAVFTVFGMIYRRDQKTRSRIETFNGHGMSWARRQTGNNGELVPTHIRRDRKIDLEEGYTEPVHQQTAAILPSQPAPAYTTRSPPKYSIFQADV
ncbi:hypothetical protein BP5796_03184 [Coleophoma crateriformis]|uniref:Uncharacterized protein n=1 Tax=Coleophoma crateriformis TaxID=565419 RepID=A0A3D8SMF9_9HELO|nr:hypothetical protein BP5796_03184 [Coleophoma crateriformis]